MSEENEFVVYLLEQLESMGPVVAKRMFGGHGLFLDNLMFGLVADEVLYLKADEDNEGQFIERDLEKFTYHKKGKPFSLSYYEAPEEAVEDEDELVVWGKSAFEAALRAAKKKKNG